MKKLWEDIYEFLSANGFACVLGDVLGIKILYVSIEDKETRAVLPLEISARSEEEASIMAANAEECIKTIEKAGYGRPIVITEYRWHHQSRMTEARLLAHLERFDHIYARNCEVRKIDKDTATEFLNSNHSYGYALCRYRYGLYLKRHTGHIAARSEETVKYPSGTLVAVATFSNARKWIKGDKTIRSYEWTRYASLSGARITGGMGKLLNAFINEIKPDDIMTYADLEWSEGKVYERLGFTLESIKAPVTFSMDNLSSPPVYFQNFGSNKYRLKLTDYQ